jgi:hypothetical protein
MGIISKNAILDE